MFRAAFPTAPEEAEKAETSWVKLTYDTTGANKSGKARFAGTWVTPEVAESLADGYSLASLIRPLTAATPNPEAIHRKKAAAASQEARSESPTPSTAASSTPRDGPNPPKRRREASPVASTTPVAVTPKTVTVKSVLVEKHVEQTPSRLALNGKIVAPSPARLAPPQTPQSVRRSTRLKSPAPSNQSSQRTLVDSPKTPKVPMPAITEDLTPGGSDETAVDEEAVSAEEAMEGRPGTNGAAAAAARDKLNVADLEERVQNVMRFHGLLPEIVRNLTLFRLSSPQPLICDAVVARLLRGGRRPHRDGAAACTARATDSRRDEQGAQGASLSDRARPARLPGVRRDAGLARSEHRIALHKAAEEGRAQGK